MSVENSVALTLDKYDELRTIQERVQRLVESIRVVPSKYNKQMQVDATFNKPLLRSIIEESIRLAAARDNINLAEFNSYEDYLGSYIAYNRPMTNEERIAEGLEPIDEDEDE